MLLLSVALSAEGKLLCSHSARGVSLVDRGSAADMLNKVPSVSMLLNVG